MQNEYIYVGCFVEHKDLLDPLRAYYPSRLEKTIEFPHVTLAVYPESVDTSLFGQEVQITVVGYGCDGTNEAVEVVIESHDRRIKRLCCKVEVPHITLSVSALGLPKNSRKLSFRELPHPYTITGILGALNRKGIIIMHPIETYEAIF